MFKLKKHVSGAALHIQRHCLLAKQCTRVSEWSLYSFRLEYGFPEEYDNNDDIEKQSLTTKQDRQQTSHSPRNKNSRRNKDKEEEMPPKVRTASNIIVM